MRPRQANPWCRCSKAKGHAVSAARLPPGCNAATGAKGSLRTDDGAQGAKPAKVSEHASYHRWRYCMRCQFCGWVLDSARNRAACSSPDCRRAAKQNRARKRQGLPGVHVPEPIDCKGLSDEHPPELEYLNQDPPGISLEAMFCSRTDPALKRRILEKRAIRRTRLLARLTDLI